MRDFLKHQKNILIEALLFAGAVLLLMWLYRMRFFEAEIQGWIFSIKENYGIFAGLIFSLTVFLFATFSIPALPVLCFFAGILFGPIGILFYMAGFAAGNMVVFWFSKYILKDFFVKKFARALSKFDHIEKEKLALYHFTLRLMPGPPAFLTSVFAGVQGLHGLPFFWAMVIGTLPKAIIYNLLGEVLQQKESLKESGLFIGLMVLLALVSLLPLFLHWRKEKKQKKY